MATVTKTRAPSGILVVGSIHHDRFSYVPQLPVPGETVLAFSSMKGVGGKGANQAVATSIFGDSVSLVAAIGDDDYGRKSIVELNRAGVSTHYVSRHPHERTGYTSITVDLEGENSVVVHSCANHLLKQSSVELAINNYAAAFSNPIVVLAQGELPSHILETVARSCADVGARFVLNLAPVIPTDDWYLELADPLIVNLGEARQLVQQIPPEFDSRRMEFEELAKVLCRSSISVVITLGGDGAVVASAGLVHLQEGFSASLVVDTTGAGDVFVGVLAASLSQENDLKSSVRAGCAAGAIAVARAGTIASYPSRDALQELLEMSNDRG